MAILEGMTDNPAVVWAVGYIKGLRIDLKNAYDMAGCCYAPAFNIPHCDPDFCRCGKVAPVERTWRIERASAKQTADRKLRAEALTGDNHG